MPKTEEKTETSKQEVVKTNGSMSGTTHNFLLGLAGVVVIALVFCAGVATQRHERLKQLPIVGSIGMRGGFMGGRVRGEHGFFTNNNGTVLSGKITNVNGNDFTLDQNGTSKTIKTDSNTRFGGLGIGGLKSGDQVTVVGTANTDGSIQARSVNVATANNPST